MKVSHKLLALSRVKLQLLIVVSMMEIVMKEVLFMFFLVMSHSVVPIYLVTTRQTVLAELYFQTRALWSSVMIVLHYGMMELLSVVMLFA